MFIERARSPLYLSRLTPPNAPTSTGWCMARLLRAAPEHVRPGLEATTLAGDAVSLHDLVRNASALGRAATTSPTMRSWRMTVSLLPVEVSPALHCLLCSRLWFFVGFGKRQTPRT